jgi:hypothetical protein
VPTGVQPEADVIVSGRLTRLDGGSRAKRLLVSQTIGFGFTDYGIGGGYCAAEAQVFRDGKGIGTVTADHQERGTGWFWIRYGDSASHQLEECMEDMADEMAEDIDEQRYAKPAPVAAPAAPAPSRSAADRLRELDSVRQQGLMTETEYQEKRRQILNEF